MQRGLDSPRLRGVWSLLDPEASERTRGAWSRLEREFGLRGVLTAPHPHFSYQIVERYDRSAIDSTLSALAREIKPFRVRTTGLATFPANWPTVYVAVEKDPSLRALHERIWQRCLPIATKPSPLYSPDLWTPHISLAYGDERGSIPLSATQVRDVLTALRSGDFCWTISIDNLTLIGDDRGIQGPVRTFPLEGR